jgi:6-phospho-3-hexuloisomerase
MIKNKNSLSLYEEISEVVISECKLALSGIDANSVSQLIDAILGAEKVYFIGVGRVMLSLQAMAKRFAHLGIDTYCVGEITEPAITNKDLLIVGSGSGESLIPVVIARKAKDLGVKIAYIGENPESTVNKISDIFLRIPVRSKAASNNYVISSKQPMTSLFEQSLFLLGDIMAQMIIEYKDIDKDELWKFHANLE